MVLDDTFDLAQLHGLESARVRHSDRVSPEFCCPAFLANVNVRRLIKISLIKPELVTLDAQDNRHMVSL
jgi:hypothetical protein